ncbi:uncharacterized protein FIBRA_09291 [Fibroporia radiculosa]|uniref:Uncharacterized protein n=1 Tax=Fibroporia radiculosa TaxID=599839 RepID=J7SC90_9APHY|nr:uncharacterized protein FIBRA_09291 [Fibroporia radiculosa]CCM06976.1 predicted protein [Fibroporia radiculosa]
MPTYDMGLSLVPLLDLLDSVLGLDILPGLLKICLHDLKEAGIQEFPFSQHHYLLQVYGLLPFLHQWPPDVRHHHLGYQVYFVFPFCNKFLHVSPPGLELLSITIK